MPFALITQRVDSFRESTYQLIASRSTGQSGRVTQEEMREQCWRRLINFMREETLVKVNIILIVMKVIQSVSKFSVAAAYQFY